MQKITKIHSVYKDKCTHERPQNGYTTRSENGNFEEVLKALQNKTEEILNSDFSFQETLTTVNPMERIMFEINADTFNGKRLF